MTPPILVKTYSGQRSTANAAFSAESATLAAQGYYPTSQQWTEDSWGIGAFLVAFALCFLCFGVLVFAYLLIVSPGTGTLTVTYQRPVTPS